MGFDETSSVHINISWTLHLWKNSPMINLNDGLGMEEVDYLCSLGEDRLVNINDFGVG